MSKDKKPFKETAVGKFLSEKAPKILDAVDDIFPPAKILTALIGGANLSPEDKAKADALMMEYEKEVTARQISEDTNVTERWKADSMSDSWMSKNARPLTLLSLLGFVYLIILTDSIEAWQSFNVKGAYVELLQMLLMTTVVAYMGGRSYEKGVSMKKK